ncbi:MAG: flagellar hook-basal body complex protein [Lachnospiraceae bacterium]|nr:flagellar hook-basal body complex protein [Lachnospiraceae bacterium]
MMRSLFSGVAGLRTHQTRMDVIGNNIANVNTTAYKSQSMTFSDLMYQTTQAASGANQATGVGGINARQIGLGSKTSAIKTAISQPGSYQTTNDGFDLMITGEAFFIVGNGTVSEKYFTRDGSFYIDGAGNLAMTSNGYNVFGWGVDPEDPTAIKQDTVQPLRLMTTDNLVSSPEATTRATVSGVVDKNDTDVRGSGRVMDLEFYDNEGYKYTARFNVKAVDVDEGEYSVTLESIMDSKGSKFRATGNPPIPLTQDATFGGKKAGEPVTLKYNKGNGAFEYVGDAADKSKTVELAFTTEDNAHFIPDIPSDSTIKSLTIDFSSTFNYDASGVSTMSIEKGGKGTNGVVGTGRAMGELSGMNVQKDGKIYATYDNGQEKLLGQIAVATFANASGLSKEGDNLYAATMNSGEFNGIGEDISKSGYMTSGVLEMSNVDLAAEFTEMITTQRGFQANSRIITVSDTLLEELTNLKR